MPSPLKALCGVLLAAPPAVAEASPGRSTVDEPVAPAGPVRVLPLGGSITQGGSIGGYRLDLGARPRAAGRTVDFVGSRSDGPGSMPDRDHEGHPGWTVRFTLPGGHTVSQIRGGTASGSVTVTKASP